MITNTIVQNARSLRQLLINKEEVSVAKLKECSGLPSQEFYMAIGWLAREGRLLFNHRGDQTTVEFVG